MPHLRMFLGEQQLDEVFIPDALLQSSSLNRLVDEEKQKLIDKHAVKARSAQQPLSFVLEYVPSKINSFKPLSGKKEY